MASFHMLGSKAGYMPLQLGAQKSILCAIVIAIVIELLE